MPFPKIAVIGAGPAGLTFARLLQQNNIPCTLYEGEPDRHSRNQGGTLDLHPKSGQRALREAGLIEEFKKHAHPEADVSKVATFDGTLLWDDNGIPPWKPGEDDKPEIDRTKLRDILIDSLNPGVIQWARKIANTEADPSQKGKYTINFADGSKETDIDLLVGADGAWSKVRPLVSDVKPFYSGITGVELWSLNAQETNPWLCDYVGAGSYFMFDEGRAIIAQRNGNDTVRTYALVRQPEAWQHDCGIDWTDPDAARERLVKEYFDTCSEDLKRIILSSKDSMTVRAMYMLPVGNRWESCPGVTLLGDAAHLMTPFGGVGVNVAMADALTLANELISRKDSFESETSDSSNIDAAIEAYEKFMFAFSKQNAEKTAHGLDKHFSSDGSEERATMFKTMYKKQTGKDF